MICYRGFAHLCKLKKDQFLNLYMILKIMWSDRHMKIKMETLFIRYQGYKTGEAIGFIHAV